MAEVVAKNHTTSIKDRSIVENCLLAHEWFVIFNKVGGNNCHIKLDLHKAYDFVNKDCVCHIMIEMGFAAEWVFYL